MNYLVCNHCDNKNAVYTPHFVFCSKCNKKIINNYTDWKKVNNQASFDDYILLETTTDSTPIKIEEPLKLNWIKKSQQFILDNTDKDIKAFAAVSFFLLVLFAFLMKLQNNNLLLPTDIKNSNDYTTAAYWKPHSITNDIAISVPFEVIKTSTALSAFMQDHVIKSKSFASEAVGAFSVTIENFEMNHDYPIPNDLLYDVKDEYMQMAHFEYSNVDKLEHIKTSKYKTTVRHGEYTLNSKQFLYDNYTLIDGYEVVNVIVSYLKNDDALNNYAGMVSESLLKNNI